MSFLPPSEAESESVKRLQAKLKEHSAVDDKQHIHHDTRVLRFYRGLKLNEDHAFEALVKHTQFRIDDEVDIIDTKVHIFEKEYNAKKVIVLDGLDHNNRPVSVCYVHRHVAKDRDISHMRMLIIHTIESLLKKSKPDEERVVFVFDLAKFSFACMDYECVKALISIVQANYPETLFVVLVMDSPYIFSACWALIRPWLDPVTQAKVTFIKRAQLGDYMDPNIVPPTDL
jgi:hypothetical protein